MDCFERVAALTALQKAVKAALDDARAEADEAMADAERLGFEKMALKVAGEKVGDMTVCYGPEGWDVSDREAFEDFALCNGLASQRKRIAPWFERQAAEAVAEAFGDDLPAGAVEEETVLDPDWEKAVVSVGGVPTLMDSGEVVPGLSLRRRAPKGTRVTGCRPEAVMPLLASLPGGVETALLGSGE